MRRSNRFYSNGWASKEEHDALLIFMDIINQPRTLNKILQTFLIFRGPSCPIFPTFVRLIRFFHQKLPDLFNFFIPTNRKIFVFFLKKFVRNVSFIKRFRNHFHCSYNSLTVFFNFRYIEPKTVSMAVTVSAWM